MSSSSCRLNDESSRVRRGWASREPISSSFRLISSSRVPMSPSSRVSRTSVTPWSSWSSLTEISSSAATIRVSSRPTVGDTDLLPSSSRAARAAEVSRSTVALTRMSWRAELIPSAMCRPASAPRASQPGKTAARSFVRKLLGTRDDDHRNGPNADARHPDPRPVRLPARCVSSGTARSRGSSILRCASVSRDLRAFRSAPHPRPGHRLRRLARLPLLRRARDTYRCSNTAHLVEQRGQQHLRR